MARPCNEHKGSTYDLTRIIQQLINLETKLKKLEIRFWDKEDNVLPLRFRIPYFPMVALLEVQWI